MLAASPALKRIIGALRSLGQMKYFLLVIGLLAALIAALIYVPMKNGESLLPPEKARQLLNEATGLLATADEDELPAMYRWRDASGNWQFGQMPPVGVVAEPLEKKEVRSLSADEVRRSEERRVGKECRARWWR